jgi:hypothetical protein
MEHSTGPLITYAASCQPAPSYLNPSPEMMATLDLSCWASITTLICKAWPSVHTNQLLAICSGQNT